MSKNQLFLLLGGLLLVSGAITLYTSMTTQDRIGGKKVVDDTRCPDCGKELPRVGGECGFCKVQALKEGKGKGGKEAGPRVYTRTDFVIFGCILFLMVGGGYLILRSTGFKFRRRKRDEPSFYTRCPKCKRKVRYAASQVGRTVLCPTCRWSMTLTPPKAG